MKPIVPRLVAAVEYGDDADHFLVTFLDGTREYCSTIQLARHRRHTDQAEARRDDPRPFGAVAGDGPPGQGVTDAPWASNGTGGDPIA